MSKGKRRTKPQPSGRQREPGDPDEFFETPFGYVARSDRIITFQGTLLPEEHTALQDAMIESADKLRRLQSERRERLVAILGDTDAVDLLAHLMFTYLHINPDTYRESAHDRSPAHVEYLALQVLGLGLTEHRVIDPGDQFQLAGESMNLVRSMFRTAAELINIDALTELRANPEDPSVDYRRKARLESLGVRGPGHYEHLLRVLHGCFDSIETECRDELGFTASDAIRIIQCVATLLTKRIQPRISESSEHHKQMLRQLKYERHHRENSERKFPDEWLDLPPKEGKVQVSAVVMAWAFRESRNLAIISPAEIAHHCEVNEPVAAAFLEAFSCPQERFHHEHHAYPGGAHPLTEFPILKVEEGYVIPVGSSLLDAVRPRMEDLLSTTTKLWSRYERLRGNFLECETTRLLADAVPGRQSWTDIKWRSPSDESDLDGLVSSDDLALRIQCKAGRLHAPTRRGSIDRMRRDLEELITDAVGQHVRLQSVLESEDAQSIGFSDAQAMALRSAFQVEVIVCLDDVTPWATVTHKLRELGTLPKDHPIPWILSLTDLMAVTDLLQGSQLMHYLIRRQRIERHGRIEAHDELDWVGNYLAEGLFFDGYFSGEDVPDVFGLNTYTEAIDAWYFARQGARTVETPKPAQAIPDQLAWLLRRLETERPQHWVLAALVLLNGSTESRESLAENIKRVGERSREIGWSNVSQIFRGGYGITVHVDLRVTDYEYFRSLQDYCREKAVEFEVPNWLGVGQASSGRFYIALAELDPQLKLTEVLLRPLPHAFMQEAQETV